MTRQKIRVQTAQEVYIESKKNREKFLAPYRKKFENAKNQNDTQKAEKAKAKIISKLIEIEPSHLSEHWIIKQVIAWLRDRECADFIEEIFIKAPKKNVATEEQRSKHVRDYYLIKRIEEIKNKEGINSTREACRILYDRAVYGTNRYFLSWDIQKTDWDEKTLRNAYNKAKKKQNLQSKHYPPYPYFGRDIEDQENGTFTIFGGR